MQSYLVAAGVIAILVGLIHSVLGEILVFRRLRSGTWVPAQGAPPLSERHVRILWATWHLATVFGLAMAAILVRLSLPDIAASLRTTLLTITGAAFLGGAILVLVATRGRHPGWIGLAGVAILESLAATSA